MGEQKGYIRTADDKGSINISEDVVAIIAANATAEVEGVAGFHHAQGKDLTNMIAKRGMSKGIKLSFAEGVVTFDIYIIADIGYCVNEVGEKVQKAIITAVEDTVGAKVGEVNVHICGVSLKKSK
ncbi:MAG: Asp23/Gls24 family envelope stress response protein [Oscillospiraceae bacterium]|nr:Asp23/Gls24 family envelope stress response protein [Oscillospiraceae bacterium]